MEASIAPSAESLSAPIEAAAAAAAAADAGGDAGTVSKKPVACIVIGMAGSGKTTLMQVSETCVSFCVSWSRFQRLNSFLHTNQIPAYLINLDPATLNVPFGANIDIRDTVNYKEVMKQYVFQLAGNNLLIEFRRYKLGPNGAIMTSLNLFATRFDQVLGFVEKKAESLKYVLVRSH